MRQRESDKMRKQNIKICGIEKIGKLMKEKIIKWENEKMGKWEIRKRAIEEKRQWENETMKHEKMRTKWGNYKMIK